MKKIHERGWIYALVEPGSIEGDDLTEIRYIGYSFSPEQRLLQHIREAKRGVKCHRCNWIRQLLSSNTKPSLWLLEEAEYEKLPELEIAWIADLKQCYELVNGTDGGDGVIGYTGPSNITPEGRERQRMAARNARKKEMAEGKKLPIHTAEVREMVAKKLRGYKHSEESKQAFSQGAKKRFQDPSERKKLSESMLGIPKSEEYQLAEYGLSICWEWTGRGYQDTCMAKILAFDTSSSASRGKPPWLGNAAFHAGHRSNLLRKNPEWYGQFSWKESPFLPYVWPV